MDSPGTYRESENVEMIDEEIVVKGKVGVREREAEGNYRVRDEEDAFGNQYTTNDREGEAVNTQRSA